MAPPGDPSDPTGASEGTFAAGELTPDDFERLSTAFRPSWELDVAPFTGPGSLSPSEIRALHGGEVHADVRATIASARSANGSHPPAKPTVTNDPVQSVIVEPGLAPPSAPAHSSAPPRPVPVAIEFPSAAHGAPAQAPRSVPPSALPAPRPRLASIDISDSPYGRRRSKAPLWIGLGVVVLAIAGIVVWTSTGTSAPEAAPTADTSGAAASAAAASAANAAAASAAAASAVAARASAAAPEPPPEAPSPPAASPMAAAPVAPPPPTPAPAPTRNPVVQAAPKPSPAPPKANAKPKAAATTIVRDVPF